MLFMLPIIQGQGFERTLYFTNTFGEVTLLRAVNGVFILSLGGDYAGVGNPGNFGYLYTWALC